MTAFASCRYSSRASDCLGLPRRILANGAAVIGGLPLLFALVLYCMPVEGGELPQNLQMHGFLSQALIWTSDNNVFGKTDDRVSPDFTEVGANVSWLPIPRLQLSAQGIYRRSGNNTGDDLRLDYGLADYSVISNPVSRLGFRLGRFKNPLGLYNDTRDVAFTRPSILLPESIYFDRTRNLQLSADGGLLYGEWRRPFGGLFLELGAGLPQVSDKETKVALLRRDFPGALQARPSFVGRFTYDRDEGRLRVLLSGAVANLDYDPGLHDPLSAGSATFRSIIGSFQYNAERWSFTAEYALRHFDLEDFGNIPDTRVDGESYYLQATYRLTPRWQALLRYDVYYANRDDRDGKKFAARTALPAYTQFARDLTLGLTWDITSDLMLRAEFHHVDGTGWLPLLDNPDPFAMVRRWDLLAVQFSYRF